MDYLEQLLEQLPLTAVLCGLDTQKTEELTAWVFTEMVSRSLNTALEPEMLRTGLQAYSKTIHDKDSERVLIAAAIQAAPGARYASVVRKRNGSTDIRAWTNSTANER